MRKYDFPIIVEQDEDGFFVASCPVIQGCYTQAKTYRDVMKRIREAIALHVETRKIRVDFISQAQVGA